MSDRTKSKNFLTSLKFLAIKVVLVSSKDMFESIIDFFNNIGNRIKMTINGVIDALPFGFVKR